MRRIPNKNWIVLDFGTHNGFFSLICASRGAKVFFLKLNKEITKNIKLYKLAMWDKDNEILEFTHGIDNTGSSSVFSNWVKSLNFRTKKCKVKTISINTVLDNFEKVDLLKCDIEGNEYTVFESITDENLNKIKRIIIETHNIDGNWQKDKKLINKLLKNNFKIIYFNQRKYTREYILIK